jgi:hypothetical protein
MSSQGLGSHAADHDAGRRTVAGAICAVVAILLVGAGAASASQALWGAGGEMTSMFMPVYVCFAGMLILAGMTLGVASVDYFRSSHRAS